MLTHALALLLLGPAPIGGDAPREEIQGSEALGGIGVHWRGVEPAQDPDEALRAGLRERLAAIDGRPPAIVDDRVLDHARIAVSRELPVEVRALHGALRAHLDQAHADFRGGRFAEARTALSEAEGIAAAHPELPGVAASVREARLLAASIAWASGDPATAEAAIAGALRLDPEARLSSRRAPPELVARYEAQQAALLADAANWVTPTIEAVGEDETGVLPEEIESEIEIEIDGVPGLRPVPPGEHLLLLLRPGHQPVAAWHAVEDPWRPSPGAERIGPEDPATVATLEALCATLNLDRLILAERRAAQVGLQGHRCGHGLGPRWIGPREALEAGVAGVVAGPFEGDAITLDDPWPTILPEGPALPEPNPPPEDRPTAKPWYRKGWIWGTSVGVAAVVAGSITAGVLLSGAGPGPSLSVDAGDFL